VSVSDLVIWRKLDVGHPPHLAEEPFKHSLHRSAAGKSTRNAFTGCRGSTLA
jgi:hypothetical protein